MSKEVFWALATSVFIVPLIGFGIYFFLRLKNKKIIQQYKNEELQKVAYIPISVNHNIVEIARDNFWSLEELQFLLNTIKMNNFKKVLIKGKTTGLEALMIAQQLNIEVFVDQDNLEEIEYNFYLKQKNVFSKPLSFYDETKQSWDFVVFKPNEKADLNNSFDKFWKQLNPKGLLVIVNPGNRDLKKLTNYLKLTQVKHEFVNNLNNKLVLITK